MMVTVCEKVEKLVRKGENADCQHFLHFPQGFPEPFTKFGLLKLWHLW